MQYALIVYNEAEYDAAPPDEVHAEYSELAHDSRFVDMAQLAPAATATSVRVAGGRTLTTDGPFADTKEVLGGFCVIEAANLDDAIDLAARIPAARLGGGVEIRPVVRR
ncbi:YciI family protein [Kribbella sp. NPDC049227]|uniref:YciI family protein n=1 Tax=Kribbella sp. NPDC049227 TaxID=3364113 RepID=UPI0037179CEC